MVQYPFTRQHHSNYIKDIQDGEEYKKLMEPGNFLSVPEHTGLILCSDGVPLFKSSGTLTLKFICTRTHKKKNSINFLADSVN